MRAPWNRGSYPRTRHTRQFPLNPETLLHWGCALLGLAFVVVLFRAAAGL